MGYHARNIELGQIWFLFPYIVFTVSGYKMILKVMEFRTTFHSVFCYSANFTRFILLICYSANFFDLKPSNMTRKQILSHCYTIHKPFIVARFWIQDGSSMDRKIVTIINKNDHKWSFSISERWQICVMNNLENPTLFRKSGINRDRHHFAYFGTKHIDCGSSLKPPHPSRANEHPQSMFGAKIRKI